MYKSFLIEKNYLYTNPIFSNMNDQKSKLDLLNNLLESVKEEHNSLELDDDDVRKSFFALYSSVVRDFYNGRISFLISGMIANKEVNFNSETIEFAPHFIKFSEKAYISEWMNSYLMLLNRNLINNSWTSFETCVSLIYDKIISKKEKNKVLLDKNKKLINLIKSVDGITEDKSSQIIQVVVEGDFTPLIRKFRKIVNKKKYVRDYKSDVNFIDFASKLRNSMLHSNGIFTGNNDYEYTFKDVDFKFENGKMFHVLNGYDFVYLDITLELVSIFLSTVNSIEFEDLIPYPEDYIN